MTDHYQQNINRSNSKQMWEELCRGYHLTQIKKGSFVALLSVESLLVLLPGVSLDLDLDPGVVGVLNILFWAVWVGVM